MEIIRIKNIIGNKTLKNLKKYEIIRGNRRSEGIRKNTTRTPKYIRQFERILENDKFREDKRESGRILENTREFESI